MKGVATLVRIASSGFKLEHVLFCKKNKTADSIPWQLWRTAA